jgi:U3 small nucleolar RNA-associated protein 22
MQKSHKITIPFPDPKPDDNAAYMLEYSRPSDINIVGSYALKTMTKGDDLLSVDMVVTMPVSILQPKDYLNYRYFYKRAYFLACIAAGISQSAGKDYDLVFDLLNGNSLQPVIVVKAGKGVYLKPTYTQLSHYS